MLEDLVISFNRYEHEAGVFALRDPENYPWWDLVRYRVQFELCVERGIYGRSPAPRRSKIVRAQSFTKQLRQLVCDIARLRRHDTRLSRTLIVSRRSLDYIDSVTAAGIEGDQPMILVNSTGKAPAPHVAITSQSVQFFTRLAKRAHRLPPEVKQDARRLAADIRARFDSRADIFSVITAKYREELVARRVWSFILSRASALESVIYVNDDMLKTLVVLARARGIKTEEVQHAYMGRTHIGFSYPTLEGELATLPDKVIITRDTGDITYPVNRVIVKTEGKKQVPVPRDIDVLVASSPSRPAETAQIINALIGQGLRLAVKLHPAENKEILLQTQPFLPNEVEVHGGDEDFCNLAWRARLVIPVNATSTTAFEAAEMGARVVLIDIDGLKKTSISESVASARATSLKALPTVVRSLIAASKAVPDGYIGDRNET